MLYDKRLENISKSRGTIECAHQNDENMLGTIKPKTRSEDLKF